MNGKDSVLRPKVNQIKMPLEEYIKDGWCCHQVCPYKKTRAAQEEGICKKCKTENYQRMKGRKQ